MLMSSKRFSTDFQPSLPPHVLSRKRRPRRPDCALECDRFRPRISGTAADTFDANRFIPDAIRDGCFLIGGGGGGGSLSPQPPALTFPADDAISGEQSSVPPRPMACAFLRARSPQRDRGFHSDRKDCSGVNLARRRHRKGRKRNVAHAAEMRAPNIAVQVPIFLKLIIFVPGRIIVPLICACGADWL